MTTQAPERTSGVYTSRLMAAGFDKPEPVILVGEEDGGWWFYLPDTWPYEGWRGETRWFSQDVATFTAGVVKP